MTQSITILAHFDGHHALVLDEPVNLPVGTPLRVRIEAVEEETEAAQSKYGASDLWEPLNLPTDAELSMAIAEEPEFNIEES